MYVSFFFFYLSGASCIRFNAEYRLKTYWSPLDWLCCCVSAIAWNRLCICKQPRRSRERFAGRASRVRCAWKRHVLSGLDPASDSRYPSCATPAYRNCNKDQFKFYQENFTYLKLYIYIYIYIFFLIKRWIFLQ